MNIEARVILLGIKTRLLDKLRRIGMIPFIESGIVRLARFGRLGNLLVRAAPNNYQYPSKTVRLCERNGIKYSLDISDYMQYCIYYQIDIEPREKLYELVRNHTTIIDVGVNIGETLLNFAQLNNAGACVGFEPVPELFEMARKNISLNGFQNIVLNNLALSDCNGELYFNRPNANNSGGIFLSSANQVESAGVVRAVSLDDYLAERRINDISLIKIDVEGFEMNVLRGAMLTLQRYRPTLFVEINDGFLKRQNSGAIEVFDFLQSLGYELKYAENGKKLNISDDFHGQHFDIIANVVN